MGQEIHARRCGRQGSMPDPDPARRERSRRASGGGQETSRVRRLQEQDAKNLHRGRRRRRALPGRQSPARRGLHRRLASKKYVSKGGVMLTLVRCFAVVCAALLISQPASAQSAYPDKPIHFVIAFVPGGATDTFARQIANDMQEALGQAIVIENRPGAGGYLAWNYV